ncbi:cysteine-rich receptor-like protein kinase [Tanacetum coccineum]
MINQADTGNVSNLGRPGKDVDANAAIGSDANVPKVHKKVSVDERTIVSVYNGDMSCTDHGIGHQHDGETNNATCPDNEDSLDVGSVIDGEPTDGEFPSEKTSFADTVNQTNDRGTGECHAAVNGSSPLMTKGSYANVVNVSIQASSTNNEESNGGVQSGPTRSTNKKVDFRSLVNEERVDNYDTVLPMSAMEKVKNRHANSLVGYFVGKSLAFPIVHNTWAKFGLQNLMKNEDGVFLFKFSSKDGLGRVLECGSWIIRNTPLILNRWTPNVSLKRNEVTKVLVWIKLHNVSVVAYSADGLSLIATQGGKPIMLDAFTSSMCEDSWGRINFARALVEINADFVLKHEVSMGIPLEDRTGYTKEVIKVEYEWKSPHCTNCTNMRGVDMETTTQVGTNDINKVKGPSASNSFDALNNMDVEAESGVSSSRGIREEEPEEEPKTSQWNEDLVSDDEVDEFIFPEGDNLGINLISG